MTIENISLSLGRKVSVGARTCAGIVAITLFCSVMLQEAVAQVGSGRAPQGKRPALGAQVARQTQRDALRPVPEASQPDRRAPTAGSMVVRDVQVEGSGRIEDETVISYLPVTIGQKIDQQVIDVALKALFATGLFADVNITFVDGTMLVEVSENPIVNRVLFDGNKIKRLEKLQEEIQLAPRAIYTKAKVQADAQSIIDVYRRSGRFAATVTPKLVPLEQNRVDIVFEVEEGPMTGVAKINFSGNEAFTAAQLRDVVLTSESRWWRFFSSNDNYDPDRLEYDRELLRQHYTKNGYADFQVVSAIAELTQDRSHFFVSFQLDEGIRYKVGEVTVNASLDKVNERVLRRVVRIQPGDLYNSEDVDQSVESLTYAAGVSGYAFVDINPRVIRNQAARTIDVVFDVNEGQRVYVDRIDVAGNTRTLDHVIRREMMLVEGDAFNRVLVDRSVNRIKSLGFFENVEIEEIPGLSLDRTDLKVQVSEQSTGSFSIGAGVSSMDRFIANLSFEERNLLGKGQYLQVDARSSRRTKSFNVSFREPYFTQRNLLAGFDLFNQQTDYEESGFVRESLGGGVSVGFPVSSFGRLNVSYTLRNDNIVYDVDNASSALGTDAELVALADLHIQNTASSFTLTKAAVQSEEINANGQAVFLNQDETRAIILRDANGDAVLDAQNNPQYVEANGSNTPVTGTFERSGVDTYVNELGEHGIALFGGDGTQYIDLSGDPLTGTITPLWAGQFVYDGCDLISQAANPTCQSRGEKLTSAIGYSLSFDKRNDPIVPSSGWRANISQSFAGLGGDSQYVRSQFNGAYYKRLPFNLIGTLKADLGYVEGFGDQRLRVSDRFYRGAATFRGFDTAGVGPRLVTERGDQAIGGKLYAIGTAEVLLPLPLPDEYGIRVSAFTDFGTVGIVDEADKAINTPPPGVSDEEYANILAANFGSDSLFDTTRSDFLFDYNHDGIQDVPIQDDASLRVTYGLSINWRSPFGPVRFDIAEIASKEDYDETESFRFSAGTRF